MQVAEAEPAQPDWAQKRTQPALSGGGGGGGGGGSGGGGSAGGNQLADLRTALERSERKSMEAEQAKAAAEEALSLATLVRILRTAAPSCPDESRLVVGGYKGLAPRLLHCNTA